MAVVAMEDLHLAIKHSITRNIIGCSGNGKFALIPHCESLAYHLELSYFTFGIPNLNYEGLLL